jgi:DNA-binding GntR family transcriptional regulator
MIMDQPYPVFPGDGPRKFQTAKDYAYQHLRHLILTGRIHGGARINQDEIARDLQISRMPVRQAVLRLEGEGLVVNRPNRGAVVTSVGPEAIFELFEMRSVLEGLALSLALPNINASALNEIEERVNALGQLQSDVNAWVAAHDELHDFLCSFAQRPRLRANVRYLRHTVAPYIRLYLSTNRDAEIAGFEHRALLDMIRSRDTVAVERMMREHVISAAKGVVDFVRGYDHVPRRGQEVSG